MFARFVERHNWTDDGSGSGGSEGSGRKSTHSTAKDVQVMPPAHGKGPRCNYTNNESAGATMLMERLDLELRMQKNGRVGALMSRGI